MHIMNDVPTIAKGNEILTRILFGLKDIIDIEKIKISLSISKSISKSQQISPNRLANELKNSLSLNWVYSLGFFPYETPQFSGQTTYILTIMITIPL